MWASSYVMLHTGRWGWPARLVRARLNRVRPRYFETLDVGLVDGASSRSDRRDTPGVAIVNETLGRQLRPGAHAVGASLLVDGVLYEARRLGWESSATVMASCSNRAITPGVIACHPRGP